MQRPKPTLPLLLLIAANLFPLAGVVWLKWDAASIVLLYWAENLVIGFYNILKMALAQAPAKIGRVAKLLAIPFFCLHFGGFCAVHGFFILMLFKMGDGADIMPGDNAWPCHFVFLQILFGVIAALWRHHPAGIQWPILGLILSHGVSFVQNYLGKKEYAKLTLNELMGQPYKRIVILHVAIIAGGFAVMALDAPLGLLCILILLKIGLDIHLHHREHQHAAKKTTSSPADATAS
ncbi:MAG: hypothetical protein JW709_10100 [Sedimentisphaerales bacterium]|nr:hypothetical protein [Sedimentisphaerales bacterium]